MIPQKRRQVASMIRVGCICWIVVFACFVEWNGTVSDFMDVQAVKTALIFSIFRIQLQSPSMDTPEYHSGFPLSLKKSKYVAYHFPFSFLNSVQSHCMIFIYPFSTDIQKWHDSCHIWSFALLGKESESTAESKRRQRSYPCPPTNIYRYPYLVTMPDVQFPQRQSSKSSCLFLQ